MWAQATIVGPGLVVQLTVIDSLGCSDTSPPYPVLMFPLPNASISVIGDTLFAHPQGTYLWLLNGLPTGQVSSWIVPTLSGDYAVQVTDGHGCEGQSAEYSFLVGTEAPHLAGMQIWPNPSEGDFHVGLPTDLDLATCKVELIDAQGRVLPVAVEVEGGSISVEGSALPCGVYLLRIVVEETQFLGRLVRQ